MSSSNATNKKKNYRDGEAIQTFPVLLSSYYWVLSNLPYLDQLAPLVAVISFTFLFGNRMFLFLLENKLR